jgi:hypothetical protein
MPSLIAHMLIPIVFLANGAAATGAATSPPATPSSPASSPSPPPSASPGPIALAAKAESKLALVKPVVDSSPAAGEAQVVQLPTWTWMPQGQWTAISAKASAAGKSVTVTATPAVITFSWGDGTASTCQGPGTPYVAGASDPAAASPTCGHTYRVTSAGQPDQQFPVTATLSWRITWTGGRQTGTLPDLTTATTVHWTVEQVQSVLVGGAT